MADNRQTTPPVTLERWLTGLYTRRSPLFAPFRSIGLNVVIFKDSLLDGLNVEVSDDFTLIRRPGWTLFTSTPLSGTVNQLYSVKDLNGNVYPLADTSTALYTIVGGEPVSLIPKTTSSQGFPLEVGDVLYFQDGTGADTMKYNWLTASLLPWGVAAATIAPSLEQMLTHPGFWIANTTYPSGMALLDANGNIEYSTKTGASGKIIPTWPVVMLGTVNDGRQTWEDTGVIGQWISYNVYPKSSVILDSNNNLQLATTVGNYPIWLYSTTYAAGAKVQSANTYWVSLQSGNTGNSPTQPVFVSGSNTVYWAPFTAGTGATEPVWDDSFGLTTSDGDTDWTNIGPGYIIAYAGYSWVFCFRTVGGNLSSASPISNATGPIMSSLPLAEVSLTQYSIASGVITVTVENAVTCGVGQQFVVSQMAAGTFLNGLVITVTAATTASMTIVGTIPYPNNISTTADSGLLNPVICAVTGLGSSDPECNSVVDVQAISLAANVVTVYCQNNFTPGLAIQMSGLTNASFLNGLILYVETVAPDYSYFTALMEPPNYLQVMDYILTPDTGMATFLAVEIYRNADGGGIYYFAGATLNSLTATSNYNSGNSLAGVGHDDGIPGYYEWANPNNVGSSTSYATIGLDTSGSPPGLLNYFTAAQVAEVYSQNLIDVSYQMTFNSANSAGNTILIGIMYTGTNPATPATISDTRGNSYVQVGTTVIVAGVGALSMYISSNIAAGPNVITMGMAFTGTNFNAVAIEMIGVVTATPMDGNGSNTTSGQPTSFGTGTITTTNASNAILSLIGIGSPGANPPGFGAVVPTGFSQEVISYNPAELDYGSTRVQLAASGLEEVPGTFDPAWTINAEEHARQYFGITVALKLQDVISGDGLYATNFSFNVSNSIKLAGITVQFDALYNGGTDDAQVLVQLLRYGAPYGGIKTVTLTSSEVTYTAGGLTDLWEVLWLPLFINDVTGFGVAFYPIVQPESGGPYTVSIRNVNISVNGPGGVENWIYFDTNTDDDLDNELIAPMAHLNDPPPGTTGSLQSQAGTIMAWWQGRPWMAVGKFLYFGGGPDIINGIPEECWPPGNVFAFPGNIIGISPTTQGLLIQVNDAAYVILGGPQTLTFYPEPLLQNFGISSPNALAQDGDQIYEFTTSRQYWALNPGKQEEGERVGNIFTGGGSAYSQGSWNPSNTFVTLYRNAEDTGIFLLRADPENALILRYGINVQNWSPLYAPAFGGATAMNSVEVTPGVYNLLIADTSGNIYFRDINSYSDNGVAYPANVTIGSVTLREIGMPLIPVYHLVTYFSALGSKPSVSLLANEIYASGAAQFVNLPTALPEAPIGQTRNSQTLQSYRWPLNMNQAQMSMLIHHCQVNINFGDTDTVKNELFTLSFKFDNE